MTAIAKVRKHAEKPNRAMSNAQCTRIMDRGCLIRLGAVGQPCGMKVASRRPRSGVAVDTGFCFDAGSRPDAESC